MLMIKENSLPMVLPKKAFIWFLQQAKVLDISRITPQALTVLTLFIAESDPKDKNRMVGLVCLVLRK